METIDCRGLLVSSNMGCYARHSSQAAVRMCRYFPCKRSFPDSTRSLFKPRTPPFWQWDRRRTRAGNTRCTQGWNSLQCLWTSTNPGYFVRAMILCGMLPCTARPSDIKVCRPRCAARKRQRRARDKETTTRQTCMGTYHQQTFRKDNKWRYTQVFSHWKTLLLHAHSFPRICWHDPACIRETPLDNTPVLASAFRNSLQ